MKSVWIADAGYLLKASPGSFDYLKLKGVLTDLNGEDLYESYYLNSTPNPPSDVQDSFHNWLKCAPPRGPKMRVQLYGLKGLRCECPDCSAKFQRSQQKGVDVGIATLILKLAFQQQYERLILSAGDGDFEDAIAFVKSELHREVWVTGYPDTISADLQSYADRVIWLGDHWNEFRKG